MSNVHIPVMLNEILEWLNCADLSTKNSPNYYFDGTLGGGGYTKAILQLDPNSFITCADLDPRAIANFWLNTKLDQLSYNNRLNLINSSFSKAIATCDNESLDGIVLDLGFSSNQLEGGERGFSYQAQYDQDLFDLRFNSEISEPAYIKIRHLNKPEEFGNIIYRNSGEMLAHKIGTAVFQLCHATPANQVVTVRQVVDVVSNAIPGKFKNKTNSILSRFWQSVRIWVNNEFSELENFLPIAYTKLKSKGRLVVVSFHSLEDKLVTHWMRQISEPDIDDVYGDKTYYAHILTKKAVLPGEKEISQNPRSRSAILRCLEKS